MIALNSSYTGKLIESISPSLFTKPYVQLYMVIRYEVLLYKYIFFALLFEK